LLLHPLCRVPIAEQALVINVRGLGLVLVTGCGHPCIERTLVVAEMVLDVPIAGWSAGCICPCTRWARR
jgi:hypothetical protein